MGGATRCRKLTLALGVALAAAAGAACDKSIFDEEPTVPPPPPPAGHPAGADSAGGPYGALPNLDGGAFVEGIDPPARAGDLKSDVDAFTSLDACVAQHASLDPVVGDAIQSIGYDTLLRDACRVLQSIKQKDATLCAAITATGLQHHCEAMVAMATQEADKCPWTADSDKRSGRDATCLAVATHDPRICAADLAEHQPTCEALTTGDATRCLHSLEGDRRACERDLARDRSLLVERERQAHDATKPRAHFEVVGSSDASRSEVDLSSLVAGGAVVASLPAGGIGVDLARDVESVLGLPSRTERAHFALSFALDEAGARVTKLEVNAAKVPAVSCPSPHCELHATLSKTETTRGSPITANVDGKVDTPAGAYSFHLVVESFVRDAVGRSAIYGAR
jgi:hypothetical protein